MPRFLEDEEFPYGGYTRVGAHELVEGDAVRFGPVGECYVVGMVVEEIVAQEVVAVHVTVSLRSVHVATVFADALHRPFEGMGNDNELHVRVLPPEEVVWIRL